MAAITGGGPKELLRLGHQTVLERVIEEAIDADADGVIVVSSPQKPQIEAAVRSWCEGRFREANLRVAYQAAPHGLADAVLAAGVTEEDALILLGDCVFAGESPATRMSHLLYRGIDGCIAVETVPDEEVQRYGICEVDGMGSIRRIVEKPRPEEIASRWAVAARFGFGVKWMARLAEVYDEERRDNPTGEISLSVLLQRLIPEGMDLKAVALQPGQERVDCGTPEEYAVARTKF